WTTIEPRQSEIHQEVLATGSPDGFPLLIPRHPAENAKGSRDTTQRLLQVRPLGYLMHVRWAPSQKKEALQRVEKRPMLLEERVTAPDPRGSEASVVARRNELLASLWVSEHIEDTGSRRH